jgi:2-phosphosulfolactate phosphatase
MPASPFDQSGYQVRLDWGAAGLDRLAPADIVVIIDVLRFSTTVTRAIERGETYRLDAAAHAVSINGAAIAQHAAATGAVVLLGALRNASAVAAAIHTAQESRTQRTSIAVIAAGELIARGPGGLLRFAVEDQLGAGAVIDALTTLGIDHTSPEAAVAAESFRALRRSTKHLLAASGSGQELIAQGRRDEVVDAAAVDAASVVPVLREGLFTAL